MIRFRYAEQLQPPAPFVNVNIRCPATGKQVLNAAALLDTAADRTVFPGPLIDALGLLEDGRLMFEGFAGEVVELPIFLAEVQVQDLSPLLIRAVVGERDPMARPKVSSPAWFRRPSVGLCGTVRRPCHNTLNRHRVVLDGPNLFLEIDRT